MLQLNLTPPEARVLGCLLEKEKTTPENYPMSLNSLVAACNQSTNRDPVVSYDEKIVDNALFSLRDRKLASMIHQAGARVQKHRHHLLDRFTLQPREVALLTVLLLRGAQTPGELRARTERMYGFSGVPEVESCLDDLSRGDDPMVKVLSPRPGQKERRYVELLSAEMPDLPMASPGAYSTERTFEAEAPAGAASRIEVLEGEVADLKSALQTLRDEFAAFRKQFE